MLASELINKVQSMIDRYGDKNIRVAGIFHGGTHDFTICDESEYYKYTKLDFGDIGTIEFEDAPKGCFLIDEVN